MRRARDVAEEPSSFTQLSLAVSSPQGLMVLRPEDTVIQLIRTAFDNYDNDLQYACFPESNPGFYNSNSFVSGLLDAVTITKPILRVFSAPGWFTPVPVGKFQ
jgi:hypothetical protein